MPAVWTSLRRGSVGFARGLAPGVRPLAFGAAVAGSALALGYAGRDIAQAWGDARHPALQVVGVDTDPSKPGDEVTALFDRVTGRQVLFGQAPTDKVGPERSHEREISQAILAAGAVALVVVVLLLKD